MRFDGRDVTTTLDHEVFMLYIGVVKEKNIIELHRKDIKIVYNFSIVTSRNCRKDII